jgi:hypothetical protein
MEVGSVKGIEQVAQSVRKGTVFVSFELEVKRIFDSQRMDSPL